MTVWQFLIVYWRIVREVARAYGAYKDGRMTEIEFEELCDEYSAYLDKIMRDTPLIHRILVAEGND